jgi:hypothetical protein
VADLLQQKKTIPSQCEVSYPIVWNRAVLKRSNLAEEKACAHRPRAAVVDDQPHPRKQPIMRHGTNHLQSSIGWRLGSRAT